MPDYNYVFGRMRSEKTIAEIPCYGTYCDLELNVGGRLDCSFNLDQTGKRNQDLLDATIPGESWVVVIRDGKPIWGGFVWSRVYQSQSKSMQLFSESWEQYPTHQLVLSTVEAFDEQRNVFVSLWSHMMAVPGRDVNIILPPATFPTVKLKSSSAINTDFRWYSELMSELSDAADGFDWIVDIIPDGPYFRKTLRVGYPTIGSANSSGLTFDYPGQILNYYATESMSAAATNVFTLGSGQGSEMLVHESTQDLMIAQGFPRWDKTVSRKDVSDFFNIDPVGIQEGLRRRPPMLTIKPSMKGDLSPDFGDWGIGDACTLAIKDTRFPEGREVETRIVKWTLNPQTSTNPDEYTVLFSTDGEDE